MNFGGGNSSLDHVFTVKVGLARMPGIFRLIQPLRDRL
jgi:hypothetical protein